MPRITQKDSWVSEYRDLLKVSFDPRHKWFVGEHRGINNKNGTLARQENKLFVFKIPFMILILITIKN